MDFFTNARILGALSGFNPGQAAKQIGDPFGDYDIFGNVSVKGGNRSPASGAYVGLQNAKPRPVPQKPKSVTKPGGGGSNGGGGGATPSNTAQGPGGVTYYSGSGGGSGGGGYSAPQIDQQAIKQLDQSIGILNDSLKRIGVQRGVAEGNVKRQYNTQVNELNSATILNQYSIEHN